MAQDEERRQSREVETRPEDPGSPEAGPDARESQDRAPETRERAPERREPEEDRAASRKRRAQNGEHAAVVGLRVVDWLFYVLYAVLGLRFLLALLGAREEAGFTQLVNNITAPFLVPFEGIVARPGMDGSVLDFPVLIAILAYGVLHLAIRGLIKTLATASARPGRE